MTPERQALIDKLNKLMELADHPNTPKEEADSARRMAANLQAKHQITRMEEKHDRYTIQFHDNDDESPLAPPRWKMVLHGAIARWTNTLMVQYTDYTTVSGTTQKRVRLQFIGTPQDLEALDYTIDTVSRQMATAMVDQILKQGHNKPKAREEFLYGYALGVSRRIDELLKDAQKLVHERALTIIPPRDQIRSWYQMNEGKLRTLPAKKTGTYNPDAFNQGQKVNLNKAVNNNSASAQTLRLS